MTTQSDLSDGEYDILNAERSEGVRKMRGYVVSMRGYYAVYASDGQFLCSADTKGEALEELESWEEEHIA